MIAVLAVETGIAPDVLLADPVMLEAIAEVVVERAKAADQQGGTAIPGLDRQIAAVRPPVSG